MDNEVNPFELDGSTVDNSFDMSCNDFKALTNDIGGGLNSSSDTLLGVVEPLRSCGETEPLLAPLDDILKDIYDIKASLTSPPTMTYPMVSSSVHTQLPNFMSPISNLSYGNYMNNENPYDIPCSSYGMNYLSSSASNFMSSPAMQIPMPMANNHVMENIAEEDNDPSPVYLNFNIDSMPPPVANFPKCSPQINVNTTINLDRPNIPDHSNSKYMEYLDDNGGIPKTRYLDNNARNVRDYKNSRQNMINALSMGKPVENKSKDMEPRNEGCSKYFYSNNNCNIIEDAVKNVTEPIYQNSNSYLMKPNSVDNAVINNTFEWTKVVTPKAQEVPSEEVIILRAPLQTKRTVREIPQIPVSFDTESNNIPQNFNMNYITVLDNSDVQIATIINRPNSIRKKRKQDLKIRDWGDSLFFEDIKTEDECNKQEKMKTPPLCQIPSCSKKDTALCEEMFLGKRKRKNCTPPPPPPPPHTPNDICNWIGNTTDPEYKHFSATIVHPGRRKSKANTPTNRDSYKTRNSERMKKLHDNESNNESSNEILVSSDSDLDDLSPLALKSLKCLKCKKIYKTPRSLAIHQKRCNVPMEIESDMEITMVEYLESEKEYDEADELSFVNTVTNTTTTVTVIEKIVEHIEKDEKIEENPSKEVLPVISKIVEVVEENPLRRSTRSQTNLNASKKLNQSTEKNNETKAAGSQLKPKNAKNTCTTSAKTTRRKKSK